VAPREVAPIAPERGPPVGSPHVTGFPPAAATVAAETLVGAAVVLQPVAVGARGRVA
jgi:hypothetical protein